MAFPVLKNKTEMTALKAAELMGIQGVDIETKTNDGTSVRMLQTPDAIQ